MSDRRHKGFTLRDYVALSVALTLAFTVWMLYNLSKNYSDVVQCNVSATCQLDGRAPVSERPVKIVARCQMRGYDILYLKLFPDYVARVNFNKDDLMHLDGNRYYVPESNLQSYLYDIFGDKTKVEYFMTDSLIFEFPLADSRKVPVNFVSDISFAPQYTSTTDAVTVPDSVYIYGTPSQLEAVSCVNTKPLVLSSVNSDVVGEIGFEDIPGIRVGADKVDYEIKICRYVEQLLDVPVTISDVPEGKSVKPYPQTAKLRLRIRFPNDAFRIEDVYVSISYADFAASRNGRCVGTVMNLDSSVIFSECSPEIFECTEQIDRRAE